MPTEPRTPLSLVDYFSWAARHWLMSVLFLAVGAVAALQYVNSLPSMYEAQTIFRLDPAIYNQGLLREIDNAVLQIVPTEESQAATFKPEVRFAMYASSRAFQLHVAELMANEFQQDFETYSDELGAYGEDPEEQLRQFVARHLHTFRNVIDGGHALRWHFYSEEGAQKQLTAIVNLLSRQQQETALEEVENQLRGLSAIQASNQTMEDALNDAKSVLYARKAVIEAIGLEAFHYLIRNEVDPNARFPKRVPVMLAFFAAWLVLGVTVLNFYLLYSARSRVKS